MPRARLQLCPACHQHSATARADDGSTRCERCDAPRHDGDAPRSRIASAGWLTRLGRATRGGLVAGALLGLAAGGVAACSDDGGKTDARVTLDGDSDGRGIDMKVADAGTDSADAGTDSADAAGDTAGDLPQLPPYGIAPVQIDDLV